MIIRSHLGKYSVDIVPRIKLKDMAAGGDVFIAADAKVFGLYRDTLFEGMDESAVYLMEAVESKKNAYTALDICAKMAEKGFKRNGKLISIGGGIIQDITGFAANIYNRGVRWEYIPTTLLAQCDSCIGAKTSLNHLAFKNILGTFYPPARIYICLDYLKTLTEDDYLSGLGETAKFNIMSARDGIGLLEKNMEKLLARDASILDFFVKRSLAFKKKFIEKDEFDRGARNLLNYAHTFGHAFESSSGYAVPHGQAVTLGLILANDISYNRGILDRKLKERIENICVNFISIRLEKQWFEPGIIIEKMKKDKKRRTQQLAAVLFKSDLSLQIVQDLRPEEVEKSAVILLETLVNKGKISV